MNDKENGLDNVEAIECTRPQMGRSRRFQITQAGLIPTFYFDMRQQTLHDQGALEFCWDRSLRSALLLSFKI